MIKYVKNMVKAVTTPQQRDWVKLTFLKFLNLRVGNKCIGGRPDPKYPVGINLVGHIRGDYGLGESARLIAAAMQRDGIPFCLRQVDSASETNLDWQAYESEELTYGINLVHVNPPQMYLAACQTGAGVLFSRYTVGFWMWEQPEVPAPWKTAMNLVDEIWTASDFCAEAFRRCTDKPVFVMPYGFDPPKTDDRFDRRYFGLPEDALLFMLSYDGNSSSERKNPLASIRAYCQAFRRDTPGVGLVIKATHAEPEDMAELRRLTEGYPNIVILTKNYTKTEFNSLIRAVDVYVSLHRSEGFGLVMAEAMLLGTVCIATNWSGNTGFMDDDVACMVPAEIVELDHDSPPFRKGGHWAQPDEGAAADYMRQLYQDPERRALLREKALKHMQEHMSVEAAAGAIRRRLEQLYEMRA